ncbi:hypothetical protein [Gaetbulibacter sp. NE]|uniref:hypothetical protein n=1 Tax=Gaetbulibacter sp. NE TaxID=2982307 RepID=UPI0021D37B3F|nr:hypothetical protein [Gaetbulibacter sp. NE]
MIKNLFKYLTKPTIVNWQFYNYNTCNKQLFSLKLIFEGVIQIKINNVKVPKRELYIVATIPGTNKVKIDLRNIFFKNTLFLEVNPKYFINFNSPKIHSLKIYNFHKVKNLYYKRKLTSFLSRKRALNLGVNMGISGLEYSKKLDLKHTRFRSICLSNNIYLEQKEYTLNEIVEQYG